MDGTIEIDIKEILWELLYKIWVLLLAGIICGVAAYGYTELLVTPMYRAKVSIYVNNSNTGQNQTGITSSDLSTSQKLVKTYVNILKSDTVLDKVANEVGHGMTAGKIRGMLEAEDLDNTEVFEVRISNADPELAAEIANAIAAVAPEEIGKIVEGSSTKIIDYAKIPTTPYAPDTTKNTMLGVVGGLGVAAVLVALSVIMDVRVKDEHDLQQISDAPVLGIIPDFAMETKDGYKDGYEYGSKDRSKEGDRKAVRK